ncbi:MAG: acyl-CoA carboxylase subunit epsilon, partial [Actinomycetes bacterium]
MTEPTVTRPADQPTLRIASGNPDPDEIAAVVAVLSRRAAGSPPSSRPKRSLWASRSRQVRPL